MMSVKQESSDIGVDTQIYRFPGRSKSSVWNHFGFQKGDNGALDKSRAVCKICRQGIRYSGNTTNLHCHLTKHRRTNAAVFEGLDESWMTVSPETVHKDYQFHEFKLEADVQSTVEDIKPGNDILSSSDDKSRSKHQQLNDTIVNFFIEHLLPLSVVESTSFYSMIAVADPMYVIPDKEILYGTLINQFYNETKKSIEMEISGSEVITVAEVWESIAGERFVSISCQLINSDWLLKHFLLKTIPMNSIPNADHFTAFLRSTFDEWGIKRSASLMNDGSKILNKAFSVMRLLDMPCCSNVLFGAAENVMKNNTITKPVIEYVIMMIGRVLQEKNSGELFGKIFDIVKDYKEIDAVTIPWTTFTSVLQCAVENENSLRPNILTNNELWQQIVEMSFVLSPLLKAYNLLKDKSSIVASMILPVLRKLEMTMTPKENDSEFQKTLKKAAWSSISIPFKSSTVRDFLLISSLLDPRYKDLQFVEETDKLRARELLCTVGTELYREVSGKDEKEINPYDGEIIVVEDSGDIIRIEPMEKRQKLDHHEKNATTDDWLADVVCKDECKITNEKEEKVMIEIDHYVSIKQVQIMPLQWWSSRETLYPILSRLARRYLCMNNFSIYDNATVKNAKLSPEIVDKLLTLHHKYFC